MMNMWFNLLTTTTLIAVQLCAVNAQNFSLSQPATGPSITCQGSDVTLQCVILRSGTPADLIWRRNGRLVDTNVLTNHQFVFNPTYNANTDLVITNVGLEDDNTEYECTVANSNITSSIVLNVTGIGDVVNLNVTDNCLNVTATWEPPIGPCENLKYIVILKSADDIIMTARKNATFHTFLNTNDLSGPITVNVQAFNDVVNGTNITVLADSSVTNKPKFFGSLILMERCVSTLSIAWTDTTQCVPVHYTVMLTDSSSGVLVRNTITTTDNSYRPDELTSDTSYTVTITGRNRVGQDFDNKTYTTEISEEPPMVEGVIPSRLRIPEQFTDDIMISWMKPMIEDTCTTSPISVFIVRIDYAMSDDQIILSENSTIPSNVTSIVLSDYFPGHPMTMTTYNITVFAFNEGGLSKQSDIVTAEGGDGDDFPWWIIIIIVVALVCVGCCTSSIFIFCCDKPVEGFAIKCCYITLTICSFGLALLVWFVYDSIKKCRSKDKEESSKENGTCYIILAVCSCGLTILIWWIYEKARSCKVKDGGDAPDSQNMPLQDTNKPVRSAAEEQALYSYARTGPINVVMEGGSSTRPGDKPRQT